MEGMNKRERYIYSNGVKIIVNEEADRPLYRAPGSSTLFSSSYRAELEAREILQNGLDEQ